MYITCPGLCHIRSVYTNCRIAVGVWYSFAAYRHCKLYPCTTFFSLKLSSNRQLIDGQLAAASAIDTKCNVSTACLLLDGWELLASYKINIPFYNAWVILSAKQMHHPLYFIALFVMLRKDFNGFQQWAFTFSTLCFGAGKVNQFQEAKSCELIGIDIWCAFNINTL